MKSPASGCVWGGLGWGDNRKSARGPPSLGVSHARATPPSGFFGAVCGGVAAFFCGFPPRNPLGPWDGGPARTVEGPGKRSGSGLLEKPGTSRGTSGPRGEQLPGRHPCGKGCRGAGLLGPRPTIVRRTVAVDDGPRTSTNERGAAAGGPGLAMFEWAGAPGGKACGVVQVRGPPESRRSTQKNGTEGAAPRGHGARVALEKRVDEGGRGTGGLGGARQPKNGRTLRGDEGPRRATAKREELAAAVVTRDGGPPRQRRYLPAPLPGPAGDPGPARGPVEEKVGKVERRYRAWQARPRRRSGGGDRARGS